MTSKRGSRGRHSSCMNHSTLNRPNQRDSGMRLPALPPGTTLPLIGQRPPSVPISMNQRCRAAMARRACTPVPAAKQLASCVHCWTICNARVDSLFLGALLAAPEYTKQLGRSKQRPLV
mgnify:CR=1 FL=1